MTLKEKNLLKKIYYSETNVQNTKKAFERLTETRIPNKKHWSLNVAVCTIFHFELLPSQLDAEIQECNCEEQSIITTITEKNCSYILFQRYPAGLMWKDDKISKQSFCSIIVS